MFLVRIKRGNSRANVCPEVGIKRLQLRKVCLGPAADKAIFFTNSCVAGSGLLQVFWDVLTGPCIFCYPPLFETSAEWHQREDDKVLRMMTMVRLTDREGSYSRFLRERKSAIHLLDFGVVYFFFFIHLACKCRAVIWIWNCICVWHHL